MDNKLSELSKPVAWAFKDANDVDHASITKKANLYGRHDFQPLYSQEYVSALLAELEAKDKRIAELSIGKVGNALLERESHHVKVVDKLLARAETAEQNMELHFKAIEAERGLYRLERGAFRNHISELEAYNTKLRGWNAGLAQESYELQAKLATPVRLPDVLFIKVSGSAVPVMHAERVKERVQAAGFTVGDE